MGFFIPALGIVDSEMKIIVSAVKIFRIQLKFWLNAKRKTVLLSDSALSHQLYKRSNDS